MSATGTGRNSRLLIVDDNRAIHEDFRKILNRPKTAANSEFEAANAALFGDAPASDSGSAIPFELDSAHLQRTGEPQAGGKSGG